VIRETQESLGHLTPEHWQSRVSYFLQQRAAVRAGEIAEWLGVEEMIVRYCLEQFEQAGQVEVLRPIGRQPGLQPDFDYYRWRQADDHRFRWQAELRRQRVVSLNELRSALQEAV